VVGSFLSEKEKNSLALGVYTLACELSARFLTDYINGDVYFKTKYPGHNLVRTKNQIALAQDVLKKMSVMDEIISKF